MTVLVGIVVGLERDLLRIKLQLGSSLIAGVNTEPPIVSGSAELYQKMSESARHTQNGFIPKLMLLNQRSDQLVIKLLISGRIVERKIIIEESDLFGVMRPIVDVMTIGTKFQLDRSLRRFQRL